MGARRSAAMAAVVLVVSGGCGSSSESVAPSGVDQLVIPTPSPDPADFVRGVDNRWFPLASGATWRYRISGAAGEGTRTLAVGADPVAIAGVSTTTVSDTTVVDGTRREQTDYYAQDRAGNVWWFGEDDPGGTGTWRAGVDGAEAGLMMAATPRTGDGYRPALIGSGSDEVAEVVSTTATVDAGVGAFEDAVVIDVGDALGGSTRQWYAAGVGLVRTESLTGPMSVVDLVEAPQ